MRIDLQQPPPQVSTLGEAQPLVNELWLLLRALMTQNEEQACIIEEQAKRIDALEEKLRTNSRNSSKPPSSDQHKGKPAKPHGKGKRKPGGQPGHAGHAREFLAKEHVTQGYRTKTC